MHLNREYRYDGKRYELRKLFRVSNLTRQIGKLDTDLAALVKAQRKALAQATPPDIAPGAQCTDPYPCEFFSHCNPSRRTITFHFCLGLARKSKTNCIISASRSYPKSPLSSPDRSPTPRLAGRRDANSMD
jgi:hypothetical protein